MPGFVPVEKYASYKPLEGEIGSVEGVRYLATTLLDPWLSAGAAPQAGTPVESSDGACADVYPILFFGKDAFGVTPFAGKQTIQPMVLNPNTPRGGDPLGQRGSISWKAYRTAVILYDAAYECFVSEEGLARSIFEVEGARRCAIEICSFSKIAGFTGTRCGYTVVPHQLQREGLELNKLWLRRQTTKFNGVPYIVQRGAAAIFTPEGMAEIQANLDYYRRNAKVLAQALDQAGIWYCGGHNSPYIWMRCPGGMDSWTFFGWLLEKANVVGTPGVGFGPCGEGYFRLTAFGDAEKTKEAARRIQEAVRSLEG